MVKKLKLKKIGLSRSEFDALVVKCITEEQNYIFVEHFYELLDIDGDYFFDFFIWEYECFFKDLDFIKDIRMRLLSNFKEDDYFIERIFDEIYSGDKKHIKRIADEFFKNDFEYIVSIEIEMGKDSYLVDEIKKVEKKLYKKIKYELEVA